MHKIFNIDVWHRFSFYEFFKLLLIYTFFNAFVHQLLFFTMNKGIDRLFVVFSIILIWFLHMINFFIRVLSMCLRHLNLFLNNLLLLVNLLHNLILILSFRRVLLLIIWDGIFFIWFTLLGTFLTIIYRFFIPIFNNFFLEILLLKFWKKYFCWVQARSSTYSYIIFGTFIVIDYLRIL